MRSTVVVVVLDLVFLVAACSTSSPATVVGTSRSPETCSTQPQLERTWMNQSFLGMDNQFFFYAVDTTPPYAIGTESSALHRVARSGAAASDEVIGAGSEIDDFVSDGEDLYWLGVPYPARFGQLERAARDGSGVAPLGGGFAITTDESAVYLDEPVGDGEAIARIAKADASEGVLVPGLALGALVGMQSDGETLVYAIWNDGLYAVPAAGGAPLQIVAGAITNFGVTDGAVFYAAPGGGVERLPTSGGPSDPVSPETPTGPLFAGGGWVAFPVGDSLSILPAVGSAHVESVTTAGDPTAVRVEGACLFYTTVDTSGDESLWRVAAR
jgi:hypothetical protein